MDDDGRLEASRVRAFVRTRRVHLLVTALPFLLCLVGIGGRLLPASWSALIVAGGVWFAAPRSLYPTACQECGFPIP